MRYGGTKFHIVLRSVGYVFLLVAYFLLQDSIFSQLPLFGVVPLLMPVCCTAIALAEGMERGGAFGVVAGVLCDIAIGSPPIGFTILLTLLGLGVGWLSDRLMGRNFLTLVLLSFGSLLVCGFFQTFTLWAFEGVPLGPLLKTVFLQTLYSLFFTVPLAGVVRHSAYRGG